MNFSTRLSLGIAILLYSCTFTAPAEIDDPFAPCQPEVIQMLYQMLKDVHEVFELYKIPYWVDSGTLLGAIRHRGIIPWDDDLDLCILEKQEERFLAAIPILVGLGYEVIALRFGYKIYPGRMVIAIAQYPWKHPGCDIFIMQTTSNKQLCYKFCWGGEIRSKAPRLRSWDEIFPLRLYNFGPIIVYGPNNPFPYLDDWYGNDWSTMAYRGYNHQTEKWQEKAVKILSDKDKKPALASQPLENRIKHYHVKHWPSDFPEYKALIA